MKRRQSVEQAGPLVLYAQGFQAELEGAGLRPDLGPIPAAAAECVEPVAV
jgi:hypothetical protein